MLESERKILTHSEWHHYIKESTSFKTTPQRLKFLLEKKDYPGLPSLHILLKTEIQINFLPHARHILGNSCKNVNELRQRYGVLDQQISLGKDLVNKPFNQLQENEKERVVQIFEYFLINLVFAQREHRHKL